MIQQIVTSVISNSIPLLTLNSSVMCSKTWRRSVCPTLPVIVEGTFQYVSHDVNVNGLVANWWSKWVVEGGNDRWGNNSSRVGVSKCNPGNVRGEPTRIKMFSLVHRNVLHNLISHSYLLLLIWGFFFPFLFFPLDLSENWPHEKGFRLIRRGTRLRVETIFANNSCLTLLIFWAR